jgi:hypothetical protein
MKEIKIRLTGPFKHLHEGIPTVENIVDFEESLKAVRFSRKDFLLIFDHYHSDLQVIDVVLQVSNEDMLQDPRVREILLEYLI